MIWHTNLAFYSTLFLTLLPVRGYPQHVLLSDSDEPVTVTVGTGGGPIARSERVETSTAILVGSRTYLVDAGNGTLQRLAAAHIPLSSITAIFITHYHIDHTGDLPALIGTRWVNRIYTPMFIVGPPGVEDITAGICRFLEPARQARTGNINAAPSPCSTLRPVVLKAPLKGFDGKDFHLTSVVNTHYHGETSRRADSLSLRFEFPHETLYFTGDTGLTSTVINHAHGADVLISEVIDEEATRAYLKSHYLHSSISENDSLLQHMVSEHMTPLQVGQLASQAHVKSVILTHLVPGLDGETGESHYIAGIKNAFSGPVYLSHDLMKFEPAPNHIFRPH